MMLRFKVEVSQICKYIQNVYIHLCCMYIYIYLQKASKIFRDEAGCSSVVDHLPHVRRP